MEVIVPEFPSYMLVWMECECVQTEFSLKVTWNTACPNCYGTGILPFPMIEMMVRALKLKP